jgi:hypothetical protein
MNSSKHLEYGNYKEGLWYVDSSGSYALTRTGDWIVFLELSSLPNNNPKLSDFELTDTNRVFALSFSTRAFHKLVRLSRRISKPKGFFATVSPRGYEL